MEDENEVNCKCAALEVEVEKLKNETDKYRRAVCEAIATLTLIAVPKRNDGTYNRCREACEKLAVDTLDNLTRV